VNGQPANASGPQFGDARAPVVARFEAHRRAVLLRQRGAQLVTILAVCVLLGASFHVSGFFTTAQGVDPLGRVIDLLGILSPDLRADALLADSSTQGSLASWFYDVPTWAALLWETVQIALVATVFGAAAGFALSLLASANLSPAPWLHWITRRTLEAVRTLPDLIVALILVAAFGVGPLPGVIALSLGTAASLGKLYSEVNETIDPRPVEAVKAAGGGWWAQVRYGVLPQVLPNHASYALLRLEVNVGGAAALGVVGAGGIGTELSRAITYTQFDTWFAILLMTVGVIMAIDLASEAIRHRLIGLEGAH
jgi:phosphonate transport system permease protein